MPWPNYDTFWEDKAKKNNIQPHRTLWVNIEFQTSSRNDSLNSFLDLPNPDQLHRSPAVPQINLRSIHDTDSLDITPLRKHGLVKSKMQADDLPQLQIPYLSKSDNHNITRDRTPVISPPRNILLSAKRRLSVGSESDHFSDQVEEDSLVDDDSLASIQNQQEVFEQMKLSISQIGGYLYFESVEYHLQQAQGGTLIQDQNEVIKVEPLEDQNIIGKVEPVQKQNRTNYTSPDPSIPSSFELTSTHIQSQKDQMDKIRLEIRRACLKVAAESYKNAMVDVPDFLLAQLNTSRDNKSMIQKNRKVEYKVEPKASFQKEVQKDVVNLTPEKTRLEEETTTHDHEPRTTTDANNRFILKLSKDDEIHALPCQCALNLIGIPGFGNTPLNFDIDESEFGRRFFSSSTTAMDESHLHPIRQASSINTSSSHNDHYRNNQRSDFDTSLVIPSGDESKAYCSDVGEEVTTNRHDLYNKFLDSWDNHEIVLVRRRDKVQFIHDDDNDDEHNIGCTPWTSLTIRCKDHDEMDSLIRDLKSSARDLIIIPFSPNPKSRLRKRKTVSSKRSRHDLNSKSKQALLQSPSETNIVSSAPLDKLEYKNEETLLAKNSTFVASSSAPVISGKRKNHPWNLNFNNYYYCELCHLNFTLLTRRHHCRACERSCCGDCSSVLVVSGGDERRYCNRCSAEILRKQSQSLQRQAGLSRRLTLQPELPGKVHPSCSRLGVSVMGKLPHWKYYLHHDASRRPAVGRISVEIIEARALPTYDMLKGKVDPYVRATITGYDRDMRWILREWTTSNRFSLCSSYCSGTLSPTWRGPGRKGGELLTLPVICTAGAILRLEVLHYNEWTHSRGKDILLGFVEIPLSDLSNSNLRREYEILETANGRKKKIYHDGYCDHWYRLLSTDEAGSQNVILSKPVTDPSRVNKPPEDGRKRPVDHTKESLKEVWKRTVGFFITPVEWFASTIQLDLPARKPEAVCEQHKSNAILHVRIKLNASEFGDLLSHVWFPPVQKYPPIPPFDPQILWNRIVRILTLTEPYREMFGFLEEVIKWKREPLICIESFTIFAIHIAVIQYFLPLLHIYLFIFIFKRMRQVGGQAVTTLEDTVSPSPSITEDDVDMHIERQSTITHDSPSQGNGENIPMSPSVDRLREKIHLDDTTHIATNSAIKKHEEDVEEEAAKLNIAVNWLAKRFLDNKGLEVMQFKLGCLAQDVKNVNMMWDGSKPAWSMTALVAISISFILHFQVNRRLLWITGFLIWYFAQSPFTILLFRSCLGFWRGIAKVTRRREIYDAEVVELVRKAL